MATFDAWKNSEAGKEKINKLKETIMKRGLSEQIASSKAEESYKKTLLNRTRKTIEEKFDQERKAIEEEIREKQAALEAVNKKVNSLSVCFESYFGLFFLFSLGADTYDVQYQFGFIYAVFNADHCRGIVFHILLRLQLASSTFLTDIRSFLDVSRYLSHLPRFAAYLGSDGIEQQINSKHRIFSCSNHPINV